MSPQRAQELANQILDIKLRYPRAAERPVVFEHGPGWAQIVDTLFSEIEQALAVDPTARVQVFQVRQKFGTLRFYYDLQAQSLHVSEHIAQAVHSATLQSAQTCEQCGDEGRLERRHDFLTVRCQQCAA